MVEAVAVTLIRIYFGCFRPNAKCNPRWVTSIGGIGKCAPEGRIDWPGARYKRSTLITVITMPLMVIGTWYGMNFEGIHELKWKHGCERNYVALYRIDGVVV